MLAIGEDIMSYRDKFTAQQTCSNCGNIESDGKCPHYHNAVPINPRHETCKHWEPRPQ